MISRTNMTTVEAIRSAKEFADAHEGPAYRDEIILNALMEGILELDKRLKKLEDKC
jgi:hypothetical protein